ncbi:MAG: hypothetical protein MUC60_16795 [Oscillatoria sp. Prado101]|jgi:hypothetical protein|nr:hypothetical protein [Oscillatoria sp. Prado101]
MASANKVRQYLAYWFQLGKKVFTGNGQESLLPVPVLKGDHYSRQFEECWQIITSPESGDCYLEGTSETIAQLLTPEWEIIQCARCPMPLPVRTVGMPAESCPCHDLRNWPNTEIPMPRAPVSSQKHLNSIRQRLLRTHSQEEKNEENAAGSKNPPAVVIPLDFPLCHLACHSHQIGSDRLAAH